MSCFWDALIRELHPVEASRAGVGGLSDPRQFVEALQLRGRSVFVMTTWQGRHLSEQERREHAASVLNYDVTTIGGGYPCAACDPFLLLLSHAAGVNVRLVFVGSIIEYVSPMPAARWMSLTATSSHME
jgi:hypothetical protein